MEFLAMLFPKWILNLPDDGRRTENSFHFAAATDKEAYREEAKYKCHGKAEPKLFFESSVGVVYDKPHGNSNSKPHKK